MDWDMIKWAVIAIIGGLLLVFVDAVVRQRLINSGYGIEYDGSGYRIIADGNEQRRPLILKDETEVVESSTAVSTEVAEPDTNTGLSMDDLYKIEDAGVKGVVDAVIAGEVTTITDVKDSLSSGGYDETKIKELEPAFIDLLDYWNARRNN